MVFRHKSPETGVSRIVTIVSHHPIVIHLESILVGLLSVDINLAILYLQVIAFVSMDTTFVNRQIIQRQCNRFSFLRNPNRTVVVGRPTSLLIHRIKPSGIIARNIFDRYNNVFTGSQCLFRLRGQRHVVSLGIGIVICQVFLTDAQFMSQIIGNRFVHLDQIAVFHIIRFLIGHSVQINDTVLDFQCLSR